MELLQLYYFQQLARTENLTQTARSLYISPPSLSATIARLERELDRPLFDRVGNHLQLNLYGRTFLARVDRALAELDNGLAEVRRARKTVLSIATTSPNVWLQLFSGFNAAYPDVTISHTLLRLSELSAGDLQSKYDFLITSPVDLTSPGLRSRVLYDDDSPVLLVDQDHPFAKRKEIRLIEARDEHFIALTPGFSSRKYFDDLCALAGFTPHIAMECDYMMRASMVENQVGVAVATAHTRKLRQGDSVVAVDIVEPIFPRSQALFWHPKRFQGQAAASFLAFASTFFDGASWRKDAGGK